MVIPEYIITMTWILAAVIIVSIIIAIFFRLYLMFLSNEKENLRDKLYTYDNQINAAKNTIYELERKIEELEAKKNAYNK